MAVAVFDHHDRRIDEHADRQRDAAQRHDVRAHAQPVHRDEGHQHRDGQRENRNQRGTEVKQENDDHEADDDGLFQQIALQRFDRRVDQTGAVVSRHDLDAGRQRRCDLAQLLLDAVDDVQRIHALAHDDDAADGFAFAIPFRNPFADIRAEAHRSQIAQQHRRSILAADGNRCEIVQRAQIAEAADHVFRAAQVEHATADFVRAHLHFVDDRRKRNAVGEQLVGIELHLILPDEAADAGDFRNSGHGLQRIAQMPVLQAAQVGKAVLAALVDDGILIDPACARRIRADRRMHVLRQTPADLLQVFDDTRARPVEIRAVLERRRRHRSRRTWSARERP